MDLVSQLVSSQESSWELDGCDLTPAAAERLASFLRGSSSDSQPCFVKKVSILVWCSRSDHVANSVALLAALQENTSVEELSLSATCAHRATVRSGRSGHIQRRGEWIGPLARLIKRNETLKSLKLFVDANGICDPMPVEEIPPPPDLSEASHASRRHSTPSTTSSPISASPSSIRERCASALPTTSWQFPLAAALRRNRTLTKIALFGHSSSCSSCCSSGAHDLVGALRYPPLASLSLFNLPIAEATASGILALFLREAKHLRFVSLDLPLCGVSAIRTVADAISKAPQITGLSLQSSPHSGSVLRPLFSSFGQVARLTRLKIVNTHLRGSLPDLIETLPHLPPSLMILKFELASLRGKDAVSICAALRGNEFLRTLSFARNELDHIGGRAVATMLRHTVLTELDLSANPLGDAGVIPIFENLRTGGTLRILRLCGCKVTDASGPVVCSMLTSSAEAVCLSALHLDANPLAATFAADLARGLRFNTSLSQLSLNRTNIGSLGGVSLSHAFFAMSKSHGLNDTLSFLSLSDCGLGDPASRALSAVLTALGARCGLRNLDVSGNQISEGWLCRLAKAVARTRINAFDVSFNRSMAVDHVDDDESDNDVDSDTSSVAVAEGSDASEAGEEDEPESVSGSTNSVVSAFRAATANSSSLFSLTLGPALDGIVAANLRRNRALVEQMTKGVAAVLRIGRILVFTAGVCRLPREIMEMVMEEVWRLAAGPASELFESEYRILREAVTDRSSIGWLVPDFHEISCANQILRLSRNVCTYHHEDECGDGEEELSRSQLKAVSFDGMELLRKCRLFMRRRHLRRSHERTGSRSKLF
ncbi:hypothetical protein DFJ73DRAFT_806138 [Zopfochytrium polystomum]|nr:hypothetical protein DFJ73DRAFT_806138 [Zopfochytrium polystomum]